MTYIPNSFTAILHLIELEFEHGTSLLAFRKAGQNSIFLSLVVFFYGLLFYFLSIGRDELNL